MSVPLASFEMVGGVNMGRKKLTGASIGVITAIVLAGCSSQDDLAGKPFGESDSVDYAPTNIEEQKVMSSSFPTSLRVSISLSP